MRYIVMHCAERVGVFGNENTARKIALDYLDKHYPKPPEVESELAETAYKGIFKSFPVRRNTEVRANIYEYDGENDCAIKG